MADVIFYQLYILFIIDVVISKVIVIIAVKIII